MGSRFVRPDTTVLHISNGDTLTVKKRLNHGEQSDAFARLYVTAPDGTLKVNPLVADMVTITAYLLDWSLTDDSGSLYVIRDQPLATVEAAINALDPDSFREIKDAIEAHERAMAAEREAKKKTLAGETKSDLISPLPSAQGSASEKSEVLM
jgi:hypothetical protein